MGEWMAGVAEDLASETSDVDLFGEPATDTPARPGVLYGCCEHCTTDEQAERGEFCADAPHPVACIQPDCGGGRPVVAEIVEPPVAPPAPKPTPASDDDATPWYNKW